MWMGKTAPTVLVMCLLLLTGVNSLCVFPRLPTVGTCSLQRPHESRTVVLSLISCVTVRPDLYLTRGLRGTSHALAGHSRFQMREQRHLIDFTPPHCLAGTGAAGVR